MIQPSHSWAYIWTKLEKDICTLMFTAALFTIAKTWKQLECPSTDEWIRKMWYIYTMEYYSAIKKNTIMPFAAKWMELENLILSEVSQKEKTNTIWYHLYLESNIWHKGTFPKKRKSWIWRIDLWLSRGKVRELGVNRCRMLPLGWISNWILLGSTGNSL